MHATAQPSPARPAASTIKTSAGRYFDLLQPHSSPVGIEEIAHALSQICRFTGHTRTHYSVAQHSWLVSWVVPAEYAMAGLMHDAAEALVGDVSSPLKRELTRYKDIERNVEHALWARFGLEQLRWDGDTRRAVKQADLVLLKTEQRDLMPVDDVVWSHLEGVQPLPWTIEPLPASMAKALFLRRFEQLGGVRS
jgi:5'-deoxynucleotidase YfbR-like HD superfamily hydrolase